MDSRICQLGPDLSSSPMRKTRSVLLAIEMSAFKSYVLILADFNVTLPSALRKGDNQGDCLNSIVVVSAARFAGKLICCSVPPRRGRAEIGVSPA